jgi:outer membrane protein assembly factor BamE (lipoprotein component of BamABCDE complex)
MAIRFRLPAIFLALTLTALLCFAARWCFGPIFSNAAIARLKAGMTADEVKQILGPPTAQPESNWWVYERIFNPGWLGVYFDENGRLTMVDHEPVFP